MANYWLVIFLLLILPVSGNTVFYEAAIHADDEYWRSSSGSTVTVQQVQYTFNYVREERSIVTIYPEGVVAFDRVTLSGDSINFDKLNVPAIAPYWTADKRRWMSYHVTSDLLFRRGLSEDVVDWYGQQLDFTVTRVLIINWGAQWETEDEVDNEDIGFQLVLATNGLLSFVIFNYGSSSYGSRSKVGLFSEASQYTLPISNSPQMQYAQYTSNMQYRGRWMFRVDTEEIQYGECPPDVGYGWCVGDASTDHEVLLTTEDQFIFYRKEFSQIQMTTTGSLQFYVGPGYHNITAFMNLPPVVTYWRQITDSAGLVEYSRIISEWLRTSKHLHHNFEAQWAMLVTWPLKFTTNSEESTAIQVILVIDSAHRSYVILDYMTSDASVHYHDTQIGFTHNRYPQRNHFIYSHSDVNLFSMSDSWQRGRWVFNVDGRYIHDGGCDASDSHLLNHGVCASDAFIGLDAEDQAVVQLATRLNIHGNQYTETTISTAGSMSFQSGDVIMYPYTTIPAIHNALKVSWRQSIIKEEIEKELPRMTELRGEWASFIPDWLMVVTWTKMEDLDSTDPGFQAILMQNSSLSVVVFRYQRNVDGMWGIPEEDIDSYQLKAGIEYIDGSKVLLPVSALVDVSITTNIWRKGSWLFRVDPRDADNNACRTSAGIPVYFSGFGNCYGDISISQSVERKYVELDTEWTLDGSVLSEVEILRNGALNFYTQNSQQANFKVFHSPSLYTLFENGKIAYRQAADFDMVLLDLGEMYSKEELNGFDPDWSFVVTWFDTDEDGVLIPMNLFQAILIGDGDKTFVIINFGNLELHDITNIKMELTGVDGKTIFAVPSAAALQADSSSNVGKPGRWSFILSSAKSDPNPGDPYPGDPCNGEWDNQFLPFGWCFGHSVLDITGVEASVNITIHEVLTMYEHEVEYLSVISNGTLFVHYHNVPHAWYVASSINMDNFLDGAAYYKLITDADELTETVRFVQGSVPKDQSWDAINIFVVTWHGYTASRDIDWDTVVQVILVFARTTTYIVPQTSSPVVNFKYSGIPLASTSTTKPTTTASTTTSRTTTPPPTTSTTTTPPTTTTTTAPTNNKLTTTTHMITAPPNEVTTDEEATTSDVTQTHSVAMTSIPQNVNVPAGEETTTIEQSGNNTNYTEPGSGASLNGRISDLDLAIFIPLIILLLIILLLLICLIIVCCIGKRKKYATVGTMFLPVETAEKQISTMVDIQHTGCQSEKSGAEEISCQASLFTIAEEPEVVVKEQCEKSTQVEEHEVPIVTEETCQAEVMASSTFQDSVTRIEELQRCSTVIPVDEDESMTAFDGSRNDDLQTPIRRALTTRPNAQPTQAIVKPLPREARSETSVESSESKVKGTAHESRRKRKRNKESKWLKETKSSHHLSKSSGNKTITVAEKKEQCMGCTTECLFNGSVPNRKSASLRDQLFHDGYIRHLVSSETFSPREGEVELKETKTVSFQTSMKHNKVETREDVSESTVTSSTSSL